MAKAIKRAYGMADDDMLERSELFYDALNAEQADFVARFPWMDAVWLTAFQNDINDADAFPTDDSVVLDIKVLTADVGSAMRQGYAALQTLGLYAKLAWPKDVARQRVFGQDGWEEAYNNTLKLQEALELAHAKADGASYKPDLLAKGYTQAEIDMLETLSDEIKLKNRLQEAAKSGRSVSSHDRIALLNVVWGHMQTINTCAAVVWANDAERLKQYQLYPSQGGGATVTTVNIRVQRTDGTPIENVTITLTNTALDLKVTDVAGEVSWTDSSLPETLDVHLENPDGAADFPDQPILLGEVNDLLFSFGDAPPAP
ncbi:MAG: hypothetical protein GC178_01855 [Flavobacteriales bacterium]|nr:hypothetical protein [Flavobacteriales bacterium]